MDTFKQVKNQNEPRRNPDPGTSYDRLLESWVGWLMNQHDTLGFLNRKNQTS